MARTKAETNGDDNGRTAQERISISVDPSLRKNMRIAAAIEDMTIGEWAQSVLSRYADKAVEKLQT